MHSLIYIYTVYTLTYIYVYTRHKKKRIIYIQFTILYYIYIWYVHIFHSTCVYMDVFNTYFRIFLIYLSI